ncbi:Pentatricopeptide repeat [Dillenia turbinata]|uniref:Pentatricopeptide repeat n=1 Tax=Dillenia turbinata TaxID=194707 RepID=A0AAN8Z6W8_9MAGN
MFNSCNARKFLVNYMPYIVLCHIHHFESSKNFLRCVHSKTLYQFNQNKPISRIKKYSRNSLKLGPIVRDNVDPSVYMRQTIGEIYKILKYSTWDSAKQQLENLSIKWDSYTVNQVLKTHPPMEKAWLFFNWVSTVKNFKHDQFTYTTMLDIFGEAKRISSMNFVFKQMQEKGIKIDVVTYTSLLHWLSNSGDIDGAVNLWKEMKLNGCRPTVVSYTAYMKILFENNRVEEATEVYKEMLGSGCSPNCYTYTVLMEHLISTGKCKAALDVFVKMQEAGIQPDKAACNILIQKCCRAGETWAVFEILRYMKENFLVLRYPVYLEAEETFKIAGESDLLLRQVNPHLSTSHATKEDTGKKASMDKTLVLNLLAKQNFIAIDRFMSETIDKDALLDSEMISDIIEANCAHSRADGALMAFEYSVKKDLTIGRETYLALVGCLIRTESYVKITKIVKEMVREGFSLGTYMSSLLIHKLGYARKPLPAAKIFNLLPDNEKNTATYTALIGAYFNNGSIDKGLNIFETMRNNGIRASSGTYSILIAALDKNGVVEEVAKLRREKRILQHESQIKSNASMEEKICDNLFKGIVDRTYRIENLLVYKLCIRPKFSQNIFLFSVDKVLVQRYGIARLAP